MSLCLYVIKHHVGWGCHGEGEPLMNLEKLGKQDVRRYQHELFSVITGISIFSRLNRLECKLHFSPKN